MSVKSHILWLVFALSFWWTSVLLTSAVQEWRQWMIFYDVHTGKPVPVMNPPDNDTSRVQLLRMGPVPCSCQSLVCGCCVFMDIEYFDYHRNGCMNMTYYPNDFALGANMLWNGNSVWSQNISGKNPPPACVQMPIPYLPAMDMCVRMYDIYTPGYNIHMCMNWEFRTERAPLLILEFDCFRMGQDGWANIKPGTPNGGLPGEMGGGGESGGGGAGPDTPQGAEAIEVAEGPVGMAGDDKRRNLTTTTGKPPKKTPPNPATSVPTLSLNIEEISNSSLTLPTSTAKPNTNKHTAQGSNEGGEEVSAPNLNLNLHEFEDSGTRLSVLNAPEKVVKIDIKLENSVDSTITDKARNSGSHQESKNSSDNIITSDVENPDLERKKYSSGDPLKGKTSDFDAKRGYLDDDSTKVKTKDSNLDWKMRHLNDSIKAETRTLDLDQEVRYLSVDSLKDKTSDLDEGMRHLSSDSMEDKAKNLDLDRKVRYLDDDSTKDKSRNLEETRYLSVDSMKDAWKTSNFDKGRHLSSDSAEDETDYLDLDRKVSFLRGGRIKSKTRNLDLDQEARHAVDNTIPDQMKNLDQEVKHLRHKRAADSEGKRMRARPQTRKKKKKNKNNANKDRDERRPNRNRNRNRKKEKKQPNKLYAPTLSFNIVEMSQEYKSGKDKRMPPITIPYFDSRSTPSGPYGGRKEIVLTYPEPRGLRRMRRSEEETGSYEMTEEKGTGEAPVTPAYEGVSSFTSAGIFGDKEEAVRTNPKPEWIRRSGKERDLTTDQKSEKDMQGLLVTAPQESKSTASEDFGKREETVTTEPGVRRMDRSVDQHLKTGSKKTQVSKEDTRELLVPPTNTEDNRSTSSELFEEEESAMTGTEPGVRRMGRSVEERALKPGNKTGSKKPQGSKKREPLMTPSWENSSSTPSGLSPEPRVRRMHRGRRSVDLPEDRADPWKILENRGRKPNRKTGSKKPQGSKKREPLMTPSWENSTSTPSGLNPEPRVRRMHRGRRSVDFPEDRADPWKILEDRGRKPNRKTGSKKTTEHPAFVAPALNLDVLEVNQAYNDRYKLEQTLTSATRPAAVTSPATTATSVTTPKPPGPDIDININNLYIYLATFTAVRRNETLQDY